MLEPPHDVPSATLTLEHVLPEQVSVVHALLSSQSPSELQPHTPAEQVLLPPPHDVPSALFWCVHTLFAHTSQVHCSGQPQGHGQSAHVQQHLQQQQQQQQ